MKKVHRFLSFFMALVILTGTLLPTKVYASEAESADSIGTSMYSVSKALTEYANKVIGSNTNDKHNSHKLEELKDVSPGIAGAVVGYGDKDDGFVGYIMDSSSQGVVTTSYGSWLGVEGNGSGEIQPTYAYLRYGYLLNDLGFDSTAPDGDNGMRSGIGLAFQGIHAGAAIVPQAFNLFLNVLDFLNPFRFLMGTKDESNIHEFGNQNFDQDEWEEVTGWDPSKLEGDDELSSHLQFDQDELGNWNKVTGGNATATTILEKLTGFISECYDFFEELGLGVILPFMIAVVLFIVLATRRQDKHKAILALVYRFVFIAIGIPLLGMLYTSALNAVKDANMSYSNIPAVSTLAGATFVDFESWVNAGRLAPLRNGGFMSEISEESSGSKSSSGSASTASFRMARETAFDLNKANGLIAADAQNPINTMTVGSGPDAATVSRVDDEIWNSTGAYKEPKSEDNIVAMINTYRSGSRYQASAWQTGVNSVFSNHYSDQLGSTPSTGDAASNNYGTIYGMYGEADAGSDWMDREVQDNSKIFHGQSYDVSGSWAGKNFNIFSNGSLSTGTDTKMLSYSIDGGFSGFKTGNVSDKDDMSNTMLNPQYKGGLSTMSMYNYLLTKFTDSDVKVYSSAKASSEFTKESHFAVNLVGSGAIQVGYALNLLAVCGVLIIIALFYGVGMVINNVKRSLHFFTAIPGAMLGALRSIVQVITYVLIMIFEILCTAFMYTFVTQLIIGFATIIEGEVTDAVADASSATVNLGGLLNTLGLTVDCDVLLDTKFVLIFGLFVIVAALFITGFVSVKMCRCLMTAYEYAWCKLYRRILVPGLQPAFDRWMLERKSLYVWDFRLSLKSTWSYVQGSEVAYV